MRKKKKRRQKYIDCIGVDNLNHVCEPHKDVTKCGVKIRTKKMFNIHTRYSCYECTY